MNNLIDWCQSPHEIWSSDDVSLVSSRRFVCWRQQLASSIDSAASWQQYGSRRISGGTKVVEIFSVRNVPAGQTPFEKNTVGTASVWIYCRWYFFRQNFRRHTYMHTNTNHAFQISQIEISGVTQIFTLAHLKVNVQISQIEIGGVTQIFTLAHLKVNVLTIIS